jgi:hypothetical protein
MSPIFINDSAKACDKYTEAIALDAENHLLYINPAAAPTKLGKLDAALSDALRSLQPLYLLKKQTELLNWTWPGRRDILAWQKSTSPKIVTMEAYAKALKLCPEVQNLTYQTLYKKVEAKYLDPRWMMAGLHYPMKSGDAAMFARFRAKVPSIRTFGLGDNLNPLGYLTAADKICNGFHLAIRRLIPRYIQWTIGLNNMRLHVSQVGENVSVLDNLLAQLTNALAQDTRGFYLDDVDK